MPPSSSSGSRSWWVRTKTGVWKGGLLAPPAAPGILAPGPGPTAEHVAPHDRGTDVLQRPLRPARCWDSPRHRPYPCAPRQACELDHPLVQLLAAFAERVLLALVGAGDVTVRRDRDFEPEPCHRARNSVARRAVERGPFVRPDLGWADVGVATDLRAGAAEAPRDGRQGVREVHPLGRHPAPTPALRSGGACPGGRLPLGSPGGVLSAGRREGGAACGFGRGRPGADDRRARRVRRRSPARPRNRLQRRPRDAATEVRPLRGARRPDGAGPDRSPARLRRRRRRAADDVRLDAGDPLPQPRHRRRHHPALDHPGPVHPARLVGDHLPAGPAAHPLRRRREPCRLRRGTRLRLPLRHLLPRRSPGRLRRNPGHRPHRPGAHPGAAPRRRRRARDRARGKGGGPGPRDPRGHRRVAPRIAATVHKAALPSAQSAGPRSRL